MWKCLMAGTIPGASRAISPDQAGACFRLVIRSFRAPFQRVFKLALQDTLFIFSSSHVYTCIMCPGAWCEGLIAGSRCHWNQITELTTGRNTAGPAHSGVKKHWDGSSFKITVTNNVTALSLISELSAFGEAFRWKDGIHASLFTRITPNPLHCGNSFQLGVESLL